MSVCYQQTGAGKVGAMGRTPLVRPRPAPAVSVTFMPLTRVELPPELPPVPYVVLNFWGVVRTLSEDDSTLFSSLKVSHDAL